MKQEESAERGRRCPPPGMAAHTCVSHTRTRAYPTFQVLDFLHVNLQLFFELPLILFQLFYQFFKVLKAEGSSERTERICN